MTNSTAPSPLTAEELQPICKAFVIELKYISQLGVTDAAEREKVIAIGDQFMSNLRALETERWEVEGLEVLPEPREFTNEELAFGKEVVGRLINDIMGDELVFVIMGDLLIELLFGWNALETILAYNEGRNLVNFYGVDPTDAEAMALLATGLPIQ